MFEGLMNVGRRNGGQSEGGMTVSKNHWEGLNEVQLKVKHVAKGGPDKGGTDEGETAERGMAEGWLSKGETAEGKMTEEG